MPASVACHALRIEAEGFHRFALDYHVERVRELSRVCPDVVTNELRLAACDALTWAVRLRYDVLGHATASASETPARSNADHVSLGAQWARHRIVHGDALVLAMDRDAKLDNSFDSPDILCDDPESDYDGVLAYPTLRLRAIVGEVPNDQRPRLRPFYDTCLVGRRVIVVCALLAGQRTLGQ